jgi:hypothetical protein
MYERKPNAKIKITKFIDKICTKKHKKSGQTTEETPGWMRPEKASNDLFPWKRDDDDDDSLGNTNLSNLFLLLGSKPIREMIDMVWFDL